jgi:putative NADPH-quinone reductase
MIQKRQALVLSCHPDSRSFCRSIAKVAYDRLTKLSKESTHSSKIDTRIIDLYDKPIDPIMTYEELFRKTSFDPAIQEYVRLMESLDLLVMVYPDWWGQMPGLLKGWIDRVFRPGYAYTFLGPDEGPKEPSGLLSHLKTLVFVTTDQDPNSSNQPTKLIKGDFLPDEQESIHSLPKQSKLLKKKPPVNLELTNTPHHGIWQQITDFTELDLVDLKVFGPMYKAFIGQRKSWLEEVDRLVTNMAVMEINQKDP